MMPYVQDANRFAVLGLLNAGLDMAVEAVTGGETVWVSDIDPGANKILAHHWPDVPNLGDISAVDWDSVQPVDILTGGFPCTDVSAAGKRAGLIRYGDNTTRSGLWAEMARAIDKLRPRLVIAENVRGLLSAKADAHPDVFDCLACMAHTNDEPMRALGAVLGDLAALGCDAAWHGVRASDVGAPHQRFRVFVIAWPAADASGPRLEGSGSVADAQELAEHVGYSRDSGEAIRLLKSPSQHPDKRKAGGHGPTLADEIEHLLPTPRSQLGEDRNNNVWARPLDQPQNLENAIARAPSVAALLPTPGVADAMGGHATRSGVRSHEPNQRGSSGDLTMPSVVHVTDWGVYADAIHRWEALTRPAPAPTETGPRGGQRLSPRFVEWMMGLPDGHVTDPAISLTRNEQLKALGNGVVKQQAEAAIRYLLNAVAL